MTIHPSVDYQTMLINDLRDPKEAAAYLNAALEDGDVDLILLALNNVAEAQGGYDKIAGKIHFIAA